MGLRYGVAEDCWLPPPPLSAMLLDQEEEDEGERNN